MQSTGCRSRRPAAGTYARVVRSAWLLGPRILRQVEHGLARPVEKRRLRLVAIQAHRRAEVVEPDRHELDLAALLCEVIQAALERQQDLIGRVARAFRKDDQRIPAVE